MTQQNISTDVQRLTRSLTFAVATAVVLAIASVVSLSALTSKQTVAVGVDAKGVLIPLIPLANRLTSEPRVISFVDECLRRSFQHDFMHYGTTIPMAQTCFTPASADAYVEGMQRWIELMKTKRMVMSTTITRPPRVVRVYDVGIKGSKVVHWDLQAEIELFFEGKSERISPTKFVAEVTVKRVSLDESPRGILLDKLSMGNKL